MKEKKPLSIVESASKKALKQRAQSSEVVPTGKKKRVESFYAVYEASRDIKKLVVQEILSKHAPELTYDEADVLSYAYWACKGEEEKIKPDEDGYILQKDLGEHARVAIADKPKLNRLIKELEKKGLMEPSEVEMSKLKTIHGEVHGNSMRLKITKAGIKAIKPILEEYARTAEEVLKDFKDSEIETHLEVNQAISKWWREKQSAKKPIIPEEVRRAQAIVDRYYSKRSRSQQP